ncbi:cysteine-rich hydrophobic domain-containing protein 2-like [Halichondria panicea]|uniref:cysteine-rich hydrophobic domain-containing protein 2-like n=1 Tax=Halichondria panicea TaxID=6063 RepID=UPI00312BC44F
MATSQSSSFEDRQGPLEPEVRLLSVREIDSSSHAYPMLSHDYRYNEMFVDETELRSKVPDPVVLRGVGGTTLFGLNNKFDELYPSTLTGRLAPEEFRTTVGGVNAILSKSIPFNLKWLMCGCLCCCCTLGLSLGPVFFLSKRTKSQIVKFLESENWRLYSKLNLNWRLHREQCENSNLRQFIILIEFVPKLSIYAPD